MVFKSFDKKTKPGANVNEALAQELSKTMVNSNEMKISGNFYQV